MSGLSGIRPETIPLCGPADTLELVECCNGTGRHAGRREWLYVAVHRSYGLWTHIYEVVDIPGYPRAEIRLIRVMAGDRRADARSWVLNIKGQDASSRSEGVDKTHYGRGLAWHREADGAQLSDVSGQSDPVAEHPFPPAGMNTRRRRFGRTIRILAHAITDFGATP